jgi:hypothetical protein
LNDSQPDAVLAAVRPLEEVVGRALEDALDERLHARAVVGARGADELVVRDGEPRPGALERLRDAVHERLRLEPRLRRGLRDLLPVLVHPDQEVTSVAGQPAVPGDRVAPIFSKACPRWGSPFA